MDTRQWPIYRASGDSALGVEFGDTIDLGTNRRVLAFATQLDRSPLPGITDIVPTYRSVLIHYDPLVLSLEAVMAWARAMAAQAPLHAPLGGRRVEIPTRYGGADGPDLEFVAQLHHLSPEEVIHLHCAVDYPVYMMGFMPGFPYLGGLPPELETPRLEIPRTRVLAGSVGLAGRQTGIYPLDSPGGWRIIGRTSIRLFDPTLDPPVMLAPGDLVRFVDIGLEHDSGGT